MFIIRDRHKQALAQAAQEGFEDRMVVSLGNRFHKECTELGEEGVRRRIRDGLERAKTYGITAERDVARFIRLMFGIRPDFDTSRKTRWAGEILQQTDVPPAERLDRVKMTAREQGILRKT